MPRPHTVYQLVRCGPGDVVKELEIIGALVDEWNSTHNAEPYCFLKHVHWSTDAVPDMSGRPQGIINRQIIDTADIIVAVFWTRFGTPTGMADSGTEEEVLRAIKKKKRVMLYFSDLEAPMLATDENQFEKVCAFRTRMAGSGLYWTFKSRVEFKDCFRRHLAKAMSEIIQPKRKRVSKARQQSGISSNQSQSANAAPQGAALNVGRDLNGSVEFHVHHRSSKQVRGYSPNSIGADANLRNYIDYLCGLWTDYMAITGASERELQGRIGKAIKTKFRLRSRTRNDLSIDRFNELVEFLMHEKLPTTPVGRKHIKMGTRLCRTFEEHSRGEM